MQKDRAPCRRSALKKAIGNCWRKLPFADAPRIVRLWVKAEIGLRRQRTAAIPAARPKTAIPLPAQSQPFAPVPATLQNTHLELSATGAY